MDDIRIKLKLLKDIFLASNNMNCEPPTTKVIQRVWKEHGLDGTIIECSEEITVPIDYNDTPTDEVRKAFMKPMTMGDLCFNVNDDTYMRLKSSDEGGFAIEDLYIMAMNYDISKQYNQNKKLLYPHHLHSGLYD